MVSKISQNKTLYPSYENGLKNVDIEYKIISLQCSWIKRLFDNTTHSWKIIPHYLINVVLGNNFVFHSNLSINEIKLKKFPNYYRQLLSKWMKHFSCHPILPSMIASECLWYNENIKIDGKTIYYQYPFSENGLNYVGQLFENNHVKTWLQIKHEFNLKEKHMFAFFQIIHALPKQWKEVLTNNTDNIVNLVFYDHHLANKQQMYCLSKLGSNTLHEILICNNPTKPSSQFYYEQLFPEIDTDH